MMRTSKQTLGLYLHIPFCVQKCRYCGFLSFDGIGRDLHSAYVKALCAEIRSRKEAVRDFAVDTVFLGGGTPSVLQAEELCAILRTCFETFTILTDAEITMESNPKTLSTEKLAACKEAGINRLSIGVQSLNDDVLALMGRIHTAADALAAYAEARTAGFHNINLDLMFGVPGQTPEIFTDTLSRTVELQPEHLSFYSLQIEEGTEFERLFRQGDLRETEEDADRKMYHDAVAFLESRGYEHYEISNAAKRGYACRHNLKYWSLEPYLGLGLGAHSYFKGRRTGNETDLAIYLATAQADEEKSCAEDTDSPFVVWSHQNTIPDDIAEYIFTGLRKTEGISASDFAKRFDLSLEERFANEIKGNMDKGLLIIDRDGDHIKLTPEGIDLSNCVMADFV